MELGMDVPMKTVNFREQKLFLIFQNQKLFEKASDQIWQQSALQNPMEELKMYVEDQSSLQDLWSPQHIANSMKSNYRLHFLLFKLNFLQL